MRKNNIKNGPCAQQANSLLLKSRCVCRPGLFDFKIQLPAGQMEWCLGSQTTLVINWLKPLTDGESANNLPPFRVYLEFQRSRCITLHLTTVR